MSGRDEGPATRRMKTNPLVLALAMLVATGGAIYLGIMVVAGLGAAGDIGEVQAADEEWAKDATRPSPRQLTAKLMGKTKDEVLATLGKPASTAKAQQGGYEFWSYNRVSPDLVGRGPEASILLTFGEDGKVGSVVYNWH